MEPIQYEMVCPFFCVESEMFIMVAGHPWWEICVRVFLVCEDKHVSTD